MKRSLRHIVAYAIVLFTISVSIENSQAHNQSVSNIDTLENNLSDTQETLELTISDLEDKNIKLNDAYSKIEQLESELANLK